MKKLHNENLSPRVYWGGDKRDAEAQQNPL